MSSRLSTKRSKRNVRWCNGGGKRQSDAFRNLTSVGSSYFAYASLFWRLAGLIRTITSLTVNRGVLRSLHYRCPLETLYARCVGYLTIYLFVVCCANLCH